MRFALLEIKMTLVKLLKKYKLERTEKTEVSLNKMDSGTTTTITITLFIHGKKKIKKNHQAVRKLIKN